MDIRFIDKPCGLGKSSEAVKGLDPRERYLIVVPFLSEVERWKAEAKVPLEVAPENVNKSDWLRDNIQEGNSCVVTHTLFDLVDLSRTDLSEYRVLIDEVFQCVEAVHGVKEETFEKVYLGEGYATLDPETGRVNPTEKWTRLNEEVEKLSSVRNDLYLKAKQGSLYKTKGAGFFVSLVPAALFCSPISCTVLTYLAESSQMVGYLRRLGIPFRIDRTDDTGFRAGFKQRLTIKDIPALREVSMTHTAQDRMKAAGSKKVSNALMNLRGTELKGIDAGKIMVSCNKAKWHDKEERPQGPFAKGSKLSLANFLPKTTRGTNKYRHCSHAIYLSDLRLNPAEKEWLGWSKEDEEAWATSELVQWIMRSRLREGHEASLYLAAPRMKALLEDYLNNKKEDAPLADFLLAA